MDIYKLEKLGDIPIIHLTRFYELRGMEEPIKVSLGFPPTTFPQLIFDFGSDNRYGVSLMELLMEVQSFRLGED